MEPTSTTPSSTGSPLSRSSCSDLDRPALDHEIADLASNFSYDSGHAFWGADSPPTSTGQADTVANGIFHLDPDQLKEIETALNVQFDNDFPEGA